MRNLQLLRRARGDRRDRMTGTADVQFALASAMPTDRETLVAVLKTGAVFQDFWKDRGEQQRALRAKQEAFFAEEERFKGITDTSADVTCEFMAQRRYALQRAQCELLMATFAYVQSSSRAADDVTLCFECLPLEPCWCPPENQAALVAGPGVTVSSAAVGTPAAPTAGAGVTASPAGASSRAMDETIRHLDETTTAAMNARAAAERAEQATKGSNKAKTEATEAEKQHNAATDAARRAHDVADPAVAAGAADAPNLQALAKQADAWVEVARAAAERARAAATP